MQLLNCINVKLMIKFITNIYKKIFPHRILGKNNVVDVAMKGHNFHIWIKGNNNIIKIEKGYHLDNIDIYLFGDNNVIEIKKDTHIFGPCQLRCDNGSKILIGEDVGLRGVKIYARNGIITFGKSCMLSYGINIRNTDSHPVIDVSSGKILNPEKDIHIGDHVWIAENATILKGVNIGNDSIVGTGAIVTKNVPPNSIVAGNPGRVVKTDINWRIK